MRQFLIFFPLFTFFRDQAPQSVVKCRTASPHLFTTGITGTRPNFLTTPTIMPIADRMDQHVETGVSCFCRKFYARLTHLRCKLPAGNTHC